MSTALPFESNVSSKYGAPMGRYSDPLESLKGKVRLRRVRFVDCDHVVASRFTTWKTPTEDSTPVRLTIAINLI